MRCQLHPSAFFRSEAESARHLGILAAPGRWNGTGTWITRGAYHLNPNLLTQRPRGVAELFKQFLLIQVFYPQVFEGQQLSLEKWVGYQLVDFWMFHGVPISKPKLGQKNTSAFPLSFGHLEKSPHFDHWKVLTFWGAAASEPTWLPLRAGALRRQRPAQRALRGGSPGRLPLGQRGQPGRLRGLGGQRGRGPRPRRPRPRKGKALGESAGVLGMGGAGQVGLGKTPEMWVWKHFLIQ